MINGNVIANSGCFTNHYAHAMINKEMSADGRGGVNFDAKVRRESFEPIDLFHAHIGSIDAFARGLKIAAQIRADNALSDFVKQRYSSFDDGIGKRIESGQATLAELETYMIDKGEADANQSGRQEMLENIVNQYL